MQNTIKRSISFPTELLAKLEAEADRTYGGNLSGLVQQKLAGENATLDDTQMLFVLCSRYHPTLLPALKKRLTEGNHARIMARFLESIVTADFDLETPFFLADQKQFTAWNSASEERLARLAELFAEKLRAGGPSALALAAEDQTPYGKSGQPAADESAAAAVSRAKRASSSKTSKAS